VLVTGAQTIETLPQDGQTETTRRPSEGEGAGENSKLGTFAKILEGLIEKPKRGAHGGVKGDEHTPESEALPALNKKKTAKEGKEADFPWTITFSEDGSVRAHLAQGQGAADKGAAATGAAVTGTAGGADAEEAGLLAPARKQGPLVRESETPGADAASALKWARKQGAAAGEGAGAEAAETGTAAKGEALFTAQEVLPGQGDAAPGEAALSTRGLGAKAAAADEGTGAQAAHAAAQAAAAQAAQAPRDKTCQEKPRAEGEAGRLSAFRAELREKRSRAGEAGAAAPAASLGEPDAAGKPAPLAGAAEAGASPRQGNEAHITVDLGSAPRGSGQGAAGADYGVGAAGRQGFETALARELQGGLGYDIVREAQVLTRGGGEGTIRLSLKPEVLGNIKIRLEMIENKIRGNIVVESGEALRAFTRELGALEQSFRDAGCSDAALELSLAQGDAAGADGRGGGGGKNAQPDFAQSIGQTFAGLRYEAEMEDAAALRVSAEKSFSKHGKLNVFA
jgi:flagellar hook-length control protein FliK